MYSLVLKNENLTPEQYVELVILVIYVLLKGDAFLKERVNPIFIEKTAGNNVEVDRGLLNKALYYMDAIVGVDDSNNVIFPLRGTYYQQILSLLHLLSQNKKICMKPVFDNIPFYQSVYTSICQKLKLEEDSDFLFFLHNLRKKGKNFATKIFTVIGSTNILEVEFYTKYDNFDKEYCNNYRFTISKSKNMVYPVGSYVFGTIQTDQKSVILYQNPECTLPI